MTKQIKDPSAIREFALAGNAFFTLVSTKTKTRFTYRVAQPDDMDPAKPVWFVSVLNGSDNTSNYAYIGAFFGRSTFFQIGKKSRVLETAPSFRAIKWFLDRILNPASNDASLAQVEFWHMDKCGRCGRPLTVPASIERGIGPECAAQMGIGFSAEAVEKPARKSAYGKAGDPFPAATAAPADWKTPRQEAALLNSAPQPDRVTTRTVMSKRRGPVVITKKLYDRPFDDSLDGVFGLGDAA